MMSEENAAIGRRVVEVLGPGTARELLDVLTRGEEDRAALVGRLSQRDDASALAEMLIEIEADPDDITRLRLIDGLERGLGLDQPVRQTGTSLGFTRPHGFAPGARIGPRPAVQAVGPRTSIYLIVSTETLGDVMSTACTEPVRSL